MATTADLFNAVRSRQCILFLGAGVHYPPPADDETYRYPKADQPPLGNELAQMLATDSLGKMQTSLQTFALDEQSLREKHTAELQESQDYLRKNAANLQRIAWFYQYMHQRKALVDRVSAAVEDQKRPSAIVRALAELDFPIVITTNYDRLFEQALGTFAKTVSPIIYDPERRETDDLFGLPRADQRWLFKMHGCVSKPDSIVITDEDYIRFVMRMNDGENFHPVPQKIRTQLGEWPTLFVGYSLLDYNLRLLFRTLRWRVKPAIRPATFSLDLYPDLLIRATYGMPEGGLGEPLVTFVTRDIWKFVPQLYENILGRKMPP